MVKMFIFKWIDPETEELRQEIKGFADTEGITAVEWAEDYAYTLADKGLYEVTELV